MLFGLPIAYLNSDPEETDAEVPLGLVRLDLDSGDFVLTTSVASFEDSEEGRYSEAIAQKTLTEWKKRIVEKCDNCEELYPAAEVKECIYCGILECRTCHEECKQEHWAKD